MDNTKKKFIDLFIQKNNSDSFVKLTLGKKRGGDESLKKVYVTPVDLRGARELSFLYRYETRDEIKNFAIEAGAQVVADLLGQSFMSAHLFAVDQNVEISYSRKLKARLLTSKATLKSIGDTKHDKQKKRFIQSENNDYLRALGVISSQGRVATKKEKKFRQINKFIEVVDSLIKSSDLMERECVSVVDMGAGKGYLTFALYDYLTSTLGKRAKVVGVEARPEIVEFCNSVAGDLGFEGLSFVKGYINDYQMDSVDMLIALHACDTATDDAMYQGIMAKAEVIVCSPCCHKQLNPQMKAKDANAELLAFGINRERQAAMVTDTLRALLLRSQGYKANVFEFISSEHTGKNIMVSAVKHHGVSDEEQIYSQVDDLKLFWGVKNQHLDKLLRH